MRSHRLGFWKLNYIATDGIRCYSCRHDALPTWAQLSPRDRQIAPLKSRNGAAEMARHGAKKRCLAWTRVLF